MNKEDIIEFCASVKRGFGTIKDSSVKSEYQRIYENALTGEDLGYLLATLEKNDLLDKKNCVNTDPKFYQEMYKQMGK